MHTYVHTVYYSAEVQAATYKWGASIKVIFWQYWLSEVIVAPRRGVFPFLPGGILLLGTRYTFDLHCACLVDPFQVN